MPPVVQRQKKLNSYSFTFNCFLLCLLIQRQHSVLKWDLVAQIQWHSRYHSYRLKFIIFLLLQSCASAPRFGNTLNEIIQKDIKSEPKYHETCCIQEEYFYMILFFFEIKYQINRGRVQGGVLEARSQLGVHGPCSC